MNILKTIGTELLGLFVDDWAFAALLVGWVALLAVLAPRLPSSLAAPLLFVGLAVLTIVFAVRQARRLRSRSRQ